MCGSVHSRSHGIFSIQISYLNPWDRWILSVTPAPRLQWNHFSFLWSKVCFFLPISSAIAAKSDCLWEQLQLVSAQAANYHRAGQVGWAIGIAKVFVCWKFLIMNDYISYNDSYSWSFFGGLMQGTDLRCTETKNEFNWSVLSENELNSFQLGC